MDAFLPCILSLLYVQIPTVEVQVGAKPLPLTEIKFQAILFDRMELVRSTGRVSERFFASYGSFTSEGPVRDSMLPFPDDIQRSRRLRYAVADNKGERLYCLVERDLHVFDISQRPMTQVEGPKTLPSKSLWGLAFDSKRDLVLSVNVKGELYAFDVRDNTSSKINEIPLQFRWLFTHLTYDKQTDRLYALHFGGPNHEGPIAIILSPEGSVITSFALNKGVIPDASVLPRSGLQLVGSGGYLGLLTPDRLVLVEPETRKTHVCWQVR